MHDSPDKIGTWATSVSPEPEPFHKSDCALHATVLEHMSSVQAKRGYTTNSIYLFIHSYGYVFFTMVG